jgi:hypothetical protein
MPDRGFAFRYLEHRRLREILGMDWNDNHGQFDGKG